MTYDEQFLKVMKIAWPESAPAPAPQATAVEPFSLDYSVIDGVVVMSQDSFEEMVEANHGLMQGVQQLEDQVRALRRDQASLVWLGAVLGAAVVFIVGAWRG